MFAQSEQSSCTGNSTSSAIPSPLVKDQASQRTTELLNMQRNSSYQNPPTFSSVSIPVSDMMSSGDNITTSARMYPYEENQMHADMTRPKRPYMTDNIQSSQTQNQRCSADSLFERGNSKHHVETLVTQSRHCNTAHDTMISGGEHYNYPPSERSRPIPDATPVWNNRRSMHSGPFTKTPRFSGKMGHIYQTVFSYCTQQ